MQLVHKQLLSLCQSFLPLGWHGHQFSAISFGSVGGSEGGVSEHAGAILVISFKTLFSWLMDTMGEGKGGMKRESDMDVYTLACVK